MELYIQKQKILEIGTATDAKDYYITDSTKTWATNQYENYYVYILSGTGAGLIIKITSNDATTLYFASITKDLENDVSYEIVYFPYERVEMFQDEKVSVTSTIQNYSDIGKLFTDYSQSFTIPASPHNNAIFSHWYESEVDNGYDARIRYNAFIEIDTVKFKEGNVQLEKANKKNNYIESYTLTFYGNLTQLKDKFGDDKLNSLDYSIYNHAYTSSAIRSRITDANDYDVKYPLIGNANKYSYQDGSPTDITTLTGAIKWNDLFPALLLSRIFLRIQVEYGITFTGSFFQLEQWKNLYLYLKPSLTMNFISQQQQINFTSITTGGTYVPFPEFNLSNDTLTTNWNFGSSYGNTQYYKAIITITPNSSSLTIPYILYTYKDGVLFSTITQTGIQNIQVDVVRRVDDPTQNHIYTFKLATTSSSFTYTANLTYIRAYFAYLTTGWTYFISKANTNLIITSAFINLNNYIPDIKISDFITGIIKAFNLIIVPKPNNTYEFLPLEMYYNAGKITDITEHIYSDELSIDKSKLFTSINFNYEESNNILNNAYKGLYQQSYGNLIYKTQSTNESSTYDIKLPFENVLFEVPTQGKLFQTATLIDKDLNPYVPKPMLIYCNGLVNTLTGSDRIYVTNTGGAATQITNYNRFSNEYDSMPTDTTHSHLMTMNFGNEQSSWLNQLAPQGLYYRHYKNYIDNLYNIKTRILKVKALLPTSLLASNVIDSNGKTLGIALNDRIIIRDKRYIINSYTTDLTTKEATFELISDYRGADAASTVGYRFASMETIFTDREALTFNQVIYLNDYDSFNVKNPVDFLVYTASSNNKNDIELSVTVPYNSTGLDRTDVIILEYKKDGVTVKTENIIVTQTA